MARPGATEGHGSLPAPLPAAQRIAPWFAGTPQLLSAARPPSDLFRSPPQRPEGGGPLTQAGDVGPAARRRHDALGVPAGDVVVGLSACDNHNKTTMNSTSSPLSSWMYSLDAAEELERPKHHAMFLPPGSTALTG